MSLRRFKIFLSRQVNIPTFLLSLSYFVIFTGQNVWRITLPNFAVESLHITPVQLGFIFSFASLPGLFSLTISSMGNNIRLRSLLFFSCILVGVGLIVMGSAQSWLTLLIGTLLLHIGIAIYYPTANTQYLVQVKKEETIRGLSMLKSLAPLGSTITSGAFLLYIIIEPFDYVSLLICTGIFVLITGVVSISGFKHHYEGYRQKRFSFKKELWPYYTLNLLNGCRSGIFRTFVPFNLIVQHGFGFKETASLMLIGSLMTFAGYQIIGYLGSHINPVRLLRFIYVIICLNFLGFWLIKSPQYLALIYLVDALLFCSTAITDSYLKYKNKSKDILADLAGGVSLYHLGGVIMPAIGGAIYQVSGTAIFVLASILAVLSFITCKYLRFND